ncbi:MAG: hypothetical protein ACLS61_11310 [Ruminococcus sp.]
MRPLESCSSFTEAICLRRQEANLSAILAEKQTLINKAIPGFTMKEDSILIVEESSFISSEKEAAYRQFLEKLLQTAHAQ